jgi:iron(III) transport system ATP-binding protein
MNFMPAVVAGPNRVRRGRIELECAGGLDGATPGARVTLAMRPEDVAVRNVARDAANGFEARIVNMEFLGSFYRVQLAAGDVDQSRITADLSINDVRDLALARDMTIAVALPRERIRVFAGD